MLENSTKDHRFLVLLIASKDPSKTPTVHYLNRMGAKSYTMKSGKNSQIMMNLSKMNYFFAKFLKMYSNIIILKVL